MAILQVNVRPAHPFRRSKITHQRQDIGFSPSPNDADADNGAHHEDPQLVSTPASPRARPTPPIWQRIAWSLTPATTVGRAILSAARRLEEADIDTAHLDAQVILAHILGVERSWLFAHYDYKLTAGQANGYTELVARRAANEPTAYLIGRKEFYGLELEVDDRVLIPRPETELLVDAVLNYIESRDGKPLCMVDVGAGSGAIALAVAVNCPQARIYATDLSHEALAVTQRNVERLDTRRQVTLLQGDLLAPLPENVDIIAANLPYVNSQEYSCLMPDVRDYEPRLALEAGAEGLDVIRRLLEQAPARLNPGGMIFLEIGHDQGQTVLALAEAIIPNAGYIGLRQDHHGCDRLVMAAL